MIRGTTPNDLKLRYAIMYYSSGLLRRMITTMNVKFESIIEEGA